MENQVIKWKFCYIAKTFCVRLKGNVVIVILNTNLIIKLFIFMWILLHTDPYCKVWLTFGDKRVEKRKTPIYKCTLNPVFNASFSYNVPWEKIRECSLDIMVMDFDNIGRNELIGRILLAGMSIFVYFVFPICIS